MKVAFVTPYELHAFESYVDNGSRWQLGEILLFYVLNTTETLFNLFFFVLSPLKDLRM